MKRLARGTSRLWAFLYRAKLVRPPMPFWRVVVEARIDRDARRWPLRYESVVTAVFVWAPTVEEAEALASLSLESEGLTPQTADAMRCPPAAAPRRRPSAVSRTEFRFLPRLDLETDMGDASRRDARA